MKKILTSIIPIVLAIIVTSCGPIKNTDPARAPRYLTFAYTQLPEWLSNESALVLLRDQSDERASNFIYLNARSKSFVITDSSRVDINPGTIGMRSIMVPCNGIRIFPAGAMLLGRDCNLLPLPGVPSSLRLTVSGGHHPDSSNRVRSCEFYFDNATGEGDIASLYGFNEFSYDYYNDTDYSPYYAQGKFAVIVRSSGIPSKRWLIFDGRFALDEGYYG